MTTTYYVVGTDDFTDETTHYIGEATIINEDSGRPKAESREQAPAPSGVVRRVWSDNRGDWMEVPETMDMTDPRQVALLVGGTNRPYPAEDVFLGKNHFVVFELDKQDVLEDIGWHDLGHEEETVIDENPDGFASRIFEVEYFWDDDEVSPEAVPPEPCRVDDASHLVGFVDGQDMHDPYGHVGTSSASDAKAAVRDVVERRGKPTWGPYVSTVTGVSTFTAAEVLPADTEFEFCGHPDTAATAQTTGGEEA